MNIKKILKLPFWTASLFGQDKSFKVNPILGDPNLNRAGLHTVRYLAAHVITQWRWLLMSPCATKEDRIAFHNDGFLLKKDYLPDAEFAKLNEEVRKAKGEVRECIQGDTLTHRVLLDDQALEGLPECQKLVSDAKLMHSLKYAAAAYSSPLLYIQSIKNQYISGKPDPQKSLHSDTFHPTMKAWLFLDDVTDENGPFTYVPGSHKLSWKRLKWEYKKSIVARAQPDGYSEKGSFRMTETDRIEMGLNQAVAFKVPKNTLVIANTHGFHCRGASESKSSRSEIWAFSRGNPFNPLIGLDFPLKRKIEHFVVNTVLSRQDKLKGKHASWHLVDNDKLHQVP
jgi:hypothetical protein